MIEQAIEIKMDLNRVKHYYYDNKLFQILAKLGLDRKDLHITGNLYLDQTVVTRLDGEVSRFKPITRGVQQGCILSRDFFNDSSKY